MTSINDLVELLSITKIKYDQQQQSFQRLVSEEARLRSELDRLDFSVLQAQAKPENNDKMRAIGAEIMWQSWVARSKTQINLKLAQVLALKLQHLAQVKKAYGKVLVIEELLEQERGKVAAKRASDALLMAIDHTIQF
ncbi:MAG: hypothetical protein ACSHXB_07800 [Sulfitobacter sp.]